MQHQQQEDQSIVSKPAVTEEEQDRNFSRASTQLTGYQATRGWQVLGDLMRGNERYVEDCVLNADRCSRRRSELVGRQCPDAIIVSCSDSRLPPEIIFDVGLGKLFPVRTAGHLVSDFDLGTIEYALTEFKSPLLIVMGHENCGAVKAAVQFPDGTSLGSPYLDSMVGQVRCNIPADIRAEAHNCLEKAIKSNTDAVTNSILARSAIASSAAASGALTVVQAIYHLQTGRVEIIDVQNSH
jgi:carbonic anhydrase